MQKRCLGKTEIEVSKIGLGTVKFGRNQGLKYPSAFELPSDQALDELLNGAAELGINFLDTAPAYGTSEERLGKLLKTKRRQWVISTKVGESFKDGISSFDFSPKAVRHSIERSLKRLNTDYLDIVLAHSNGEDQRIIEEEEIFLTLDTLKKEGKLRAYGMSTKTVTGGLLTIAQSDVAMVTFNPTWPNEREVIRTAHQQRKGILIKKALASGHLQTISSENPLENAMHFIFSEPGVTSAIIGTINLSHLKQLKNY